MMKLQKGTGLVEILVSILVMGVGILGMVGLQTVSLKRNNEALTFSAANQLASDLFERMRTNQVEVATTTNYQLSFDSTLSEPKDCAANVCTASELAAYDIYAWSNKVASNLPSGKASIEIEAVSGKNQSAKVTVAIRYQHDVEDSITLAEEDSAYEQFIFTARI